MKLFNKFLMIAAVVVFSTGCEDYLDEPAPSAAVSEDQVFKSEAGVRAFFNGIYRNLRTQWTNGSSGGDTDTWGIVSLNLTREMKGDDVINPGGWYQWDYRLENRQSTYRKVNFVWDFLYQTVNQANVMIQGVEGSDFSDEIKDEFIAEARAIRAWAYFQLAREFQHTPTADPDAPGVPIYLAPATGDTEGNPRGTIMDVYDQIVSDLEFAVLHLDQERVLESNINLNVAQGLLARVYLELHEWEKARDAAIAAREGYELDAESYTSGFNDIDKNPEWMWAFPQSVDQTLYYGTPASFWDHLVLGYNNFYMNENLVNSFSESDVRNLFLESGSDLEYEKYVTTKFTQQEDFSDDFVMMRVAEMYLIEAEARAELGDATAADVLYTLQSNRDPNAVRSGNTGQALIDEILLERRKELYGELGINFLDIKRRELPLERTGNHVPKYKENLNRDPNSPDFILKIPQREIDANPNITLEDQND